MKKFNLIILLIFTIVLTACNQETNTNAENTQSWPEDNLKFIVPMSEGGSVDALARGLASNWEDDIGQQIIVENQSGSSGLLGATSFLESESDGHTFLVGLQPTLSMNRVVQGADFSLEDFEFINIEQQDYGSIIVPADSPYDTMEELIEDVQENPGKVTMSVAAGAGTSLFGYALIDMLDLDVNVVTFDSGGEQRTDLLGGHSDFAASGAFGDLAIQDDIKVLTVASEEPFPGFDAPPINEVLADYTDETMPPIGDSRFIAVQKDFAENNPEAFDDIVASYKENFESEEYQNYIEDRGADIISEYYGPEESREIMESLDGVVEDYEDVLQGQ